MHAQERSPQPDARAARVNGVTILAEEVDAKLGNNLAALQEQIYALRQKQLEAMIDQALLEAEAAKRRVTLAALVQAEITSRVTPATADDAARFYAENKARIQGDLASRREQIQSLLTAQRLEDRQQEFVASLRATATIETFLTPPPVFRATIATAGAPVRGPATAPVTIVEFSDFHCPYCKRVQPVLSQLLAKYGDKVNLVFRDYPVDVLHPQARAASEAARCATEQGKFWEFHDELFEIGARRRARNAGSAGQGGRSRRDGVHRLPDVRQVQSRGAGQQRGRHGTRNRRDADVLHQRPDPGRSAADRRLRQDHRRGARGAPVRPAASSCPTFATSPPVRRAARGATPAALRRALHKH